MVNTWNQILNLKKYMLHVYILIWSQKNIWDSYCWSEECKNDKQFKKKKIFEIHGMSEIFTHVKYAWYDKIGHLQSILL